MVFDIYAPSLKLAFEYQGLQHYHSHYLFADSLYNKLRDSEKRQACNFLDISLIEVPYWWKLDKESIIAFIQNSRPDILGDA